MRREWRWLVLVLCGILLLIAGSAAAEAQDEWAYRTDGQLAYVTAWKGTGSQAEIPETIDGYYVAGVDAGAFGEDVTEVVFPVSVSEISDEAMKAGTTVAARHGAPALQWAEEHGYPARDLSERDFTSLIVDLTGTEYQKTEEGINLSPALGKALQARQAIYIPETGFAWGINSLEDAGERVLARVEKVDPLLTYNEVIIQSAMALEDDAPDGLSFDNEGNAVVKYKPENEYRFPTPVHEEGHWLTLTMVYSNVDIYLKVNTANLVATACPILLPAAWGWNLGSVISGQQENMIDLNTLVYNAKLSFDYDVYLDVARSNNLITAPDEELVAEFEIHPFGRLPVGQTPFSVTPLGMVQISTSDDTRWETGFEGGHFDIEYSNLNGHRSITGNGLTMGTPFVRTEEVNNTKVALLAGFSLDLKPCFSLMELFYCWELGLKEETAHEENYAGTSDCKEVTWTAERKGQFTFCPGVDFDILKAKKVKVNLYIQSSHERPNGISWGFTSGTLNSIYITKEFFKTQMEMPITICGQEVWPGNSVHMERDQNGVWYVVDRCQRKHMLVFHTGIPGEEPVYKDCSLYQKGSQFYDTEWVPQWIGKNFIGWYTEDDVLFYASDINNLIQSGEWVDEYHLYAKWRDDEEGYSGQGDNNEDTRIIFSLNEYIDDGHIYWGVNGHNRENAQQEYTDWFAQKVAESTEGELSGNLGYYGATSYRMNDPDRPQTIRGWMNYWNNEDINVIGGHHSANVVNVVLGSRVFMTDGYSFSPNLETVSCGNKVQEIGSYENCSKLRAINIPSGVGFLQDKAFRNCFALKNISIPASVTWIGRAVFENSGLESISIPSSISYIPQNAFRNCGGLQTAELPETITDIGNEAFANDSLLKNLTLPEHLNSIGEKAFRNCFMLEEITIDADYIYAEAFNNCVGLKKATIRTNETWNSFNSCSQLEEVDIDIGIIHERTFENCNALTEVTARTERIEKCAFGHNNALEKINIQGNQVEVAEGAFIGSPLKEMTIEANELRQLQINSQDSLETVTIHAGSITESLYIKNPGLKQLSIECSRCDGNIVIENCIRLESIEILNEETLQVLQIGNCPNLKSLTVGGESRDLQVKDCRGLAEMNVGPVTEKYEFLRLNTLESIEIKDGWTGDSSSRIEECNRLREVRVSANVEFELSQIVGCTDTELIWTAPEEIQGGTVLHFRSDYGTENEDWHVSPGSNVPAFTPARMKQEGTERLEMAGWILNGDTSRLIIPGESFAMPGGESTLYAAYALRFEEGEMEDEDGVLTYYRRPFTMKDEMMIIPAWIHSLEPWSIDPMETKVYIGSQVTHIDPAAFINAINLQRIIVDPENSEFYDDEGVLYSRDGKLICVPQKTTLREIAVPDGIRKIEAYAFIGTGESSINLISLPESVEEFADGCFEGLMEGTLVFGPTNENAAGMAQAAGVNYNMYPVYFMSGDMLVSMAMAQAGEKLGPFAALSGNGFLGWSMTPDGEIISGQITMPNRKLELYARWAADPPESVFYLPDGLVSAEEEAFYGMRATSVYIPGNVKTIQALAFAGNSRLRDVIVISRDAEIAPNAFAGAAEELTIYGYDGSTAEAFAEAQGYEFVKLSPWGR